MKRLATAALAALLALVPASGLADGMAARVDINFNDYSPARVDVLAGDPVDWSNVSSRNHTVTEDNGAYDSGVMYPGDAYEHVFSSAGTFTYHCRLHPYIRGEVDVYDLLLQTPASPAQANQPYPLHGRAALPAGSAVSIQFDDGSGSGWHDVAEATVGDDGSFVGEVAPATSGNYRAVAGDQTSPAVQLLVLDRSISARVVHGRVIATVTPPSPGATVVLQLHLRERFGWWPVAQHRVDKSSRTAFTPHIGRRVAARVVLTLPDGATSLATSPTLRVGPARRR